MLFINLWCKALTYIRFKYSNNISLRCKDWFWRNISVISVIPLLQTEASDNLHLSSCFYYTLNVLHVSYVTKYQIYKNSHISLKKKTNNTNYVYSPLVYPLYILCTNTFQSDIFRNQFSINTLLTLSLIHI